MMKIPSPWSDPPEHILGGKNPYHSVPLASYQTVQSKANLVKLIPSGRVVVGMPDERNGNETKKGLMASVRVSKQRVYEQR